MNNKKRLEYFATRKKNINNRIKLEYLEAAFRLLQVGAFELELSRRSQGLDNECESLAEGLTAELESMVEEILEDIADSDNQELKLNRYLSRAWGDFANSILGISQKPIFRKARREMMRRQRLYGNSPYYVGYSTIDKPATPMPLITASEQ